MAYSADDKAMYPDVPWRDIAGIRNILRHEYQRVADPVIWLTATQSLPKRRPVIERMIAADPNIGARGSSSAGIRAVRNRAGL